MTTSKSTWLGLTLAVLAMGAPALADDRQPQAQEPPPVSQPPIEQAPIERPQADEKCIEQCDNRSDKCMQAAEGDAAKLQACDDQYSDCLKACQSGGS
jgi:hypothetical protein